MSFTSLIFLIFFVIVLAVYYKIPKRWQWLWLLIGSYVFYMWSSPWMALCLVFSTVTTWLFSLLIGKCKYVICLCVICNIGLLALFKYSASFVSWLNSVPWIEKSVLLPEWFVLPLGISFYTFQSLGYVIDVYRGSIVPQRNLLKYALYVSFFPQICQGPIGRYDDLAGQLYAGHAFDYDRMVMGFERMILGFFKKLVVANRIGPFVDYIYDTPDEYSSLILSLATVMYAIQLYADFSGYMDIAIGAGQCLGISLTENFKTPYFSKSISEYWRRWHITLGAWFRDYLYYPILRSSWCLKLGKYITAKKSRKVAGSVTTAIGLALTWVLIGMWHGVSLNYVVHGVYHGFFIITSSLLAGRYTKIRQGLHINEKSKVWHAFQIVRTFGIVTIGYVLFRSADLSQALLIYMRIFGAAGSENWVHGGIAGMTNGIFGWFNIGIALILCVVIEIISNKEDIIIWINKKSRRLRWSFIYILLFMICLFSIVGSDTSGGFIYFNF